MLLVDYEYRDGRGRSGVSGGMLVLGGKVLSKQQTLSDIPQDVQELKTRLRACFRGTVELRQFTVTFPAEPGKPDRTTGPVDLNRATADDLRHVPGIGEILARRIVEYRNTHGPFRSVDDLGKVPGIGDATLSRLRKHLRVSAEPQ
jgi:competence protein ComEA